MPNPQKMSAGDWALLVLLSGLWGGSFFFSKVALVELPPLVLVLARVAIAAIGLGAYIWMRGISVPRSWSAWITFAGMGVLNNLIPYSLIFWGQTSIGSGLASILNATTPVFSLLVGHAFTTDEKLSANKCVGIGLGVAGVVILVGRDALTGADRSVLAMLACLGAAFSYGLAAVYGKHFRRLGIPPAIGAFGQVTMTAIMMIPIVLIADPPWRLAMPTAPVCAAVMALALLSTAFAYVLYFRIMGRAGGTNASLVTLLIPVSAIFLGRTFLAERLTLGQFIGMALIGFGLIAIDGRLWESLRPSKPG